MSYEERYATSIGSTDLSLCNRERKDLDYIIAMGYTKNAVGAMLTRLMAEWERSPLRANRCDMTTMLMHLRSYPQVAHALELWLVKQGKHDKLGLIPAAVEHWLNRLCTKCHGAGFVAHDGKEVQCRKCKGLLTRPEPQDPDMRGMLSYMDDYKQSSVTGAVKRLR